MNTVMVIPGTAAQIPLIKKLKSLNYKVVCVNPRADSPAFQYSDYCEQYDILNVEDCTAVAKKYNICAVLSDECDIAMPTVAAISEQLHLPSIGKKFASLYTNKFEMREFCKQNNFSYPSYQKCKTIEEAKDFFHSLVHPKMIIKPLDSNSSRGVYTITNIEHLTDLFDQSMAFSRIEKNVLCEEYIEGTEFTIDGIVINGKHNSLAVSEKKHYSHHSNIACELYFSHSSDKYDYEQLKSINDCFVEKTGLPFGLTHAEYKYDGSKFILIEIGARGGGNFISSHIVPIMTGIDNYSLFIEQTLRSNTKNNAQINIPFDYLNRCCVLKFFDIDYNNNGKKIVAIRGEEFLKTPNVLLYNFNFEIGDTLHFAENDSSRIGFYIAYGTSKEELNTLITTLDNHVKFEFKGDA